MLHLSKIKTIGDPATTLDVTTYLLLLDVGSLNAKLILHVRNKTPTHLQHRLVCCMSARPRRPVFDCLPTLRMGLLMYP